MVRYIAASRRSQGQLGCFAVGAGAGAATAVGEGVGGDEEVVFARFGKW
jgi:hypothetical protein